MIHTLKEQDVKLGRMNLAQVGVLRWVIMKNGNGPVAQQMADVLHLLIPNVSIIIL
jgi:hypothetical protein